MIPYTLVLPLTIRLETVSLHHHLTNNSIVSKKTKNLIFIKK